MEKISATGIICGDELKLARILTVIDGGAWILYCFIHRHANGEINNLAKCLFYTENNYNYIPIVIRKRIKILRLTK